MRKTDAALIATATVLSAALIGSKWRPSPDEPRNMVWYATLHKPSWRPSGATIGTAWTALDILMAYSGSRLLAARPSPARTTAVASWATATTGLALYPFLMFGRHRLGAALASVVGMLAATTTTVATAASVDKRAAAALLPLTAWLTLAGILQEEIWRHNR